MLYQWHAFAALRTISPQHPRSYLTPYRIHPPGSTRRDLYPSPHHHLHHGSSVAAPIDRPRTCIMLPHRVLCSRASTLAVHHRRLLSSTFSALHPLRPSHRRPTFWIFRHCNLHYISIHFLATWHTFLPSRDYSTPSPRPQAHYITGFYSHVP